MLILGIDFETEGLDSATHRVIEVGAVLWDTEFRTPVSLMSELICPGKPLSPEITKITGITDSMLLQHSKSFSWVWGQLFNMYHRADFICAHNAPFDKSFFDAECSRLKETPKPKEWIDTVTDVEYPEHVKHKNLLYLAAAHQFLNPFAHRAVFDVLTMLRVLDNYNIDEVIALARQPSVTLRALVSFDQKDLAKSAGYYWDGEKKIWYKQLKESKAAAELLIPREFKVANLGVVK